MIDNSVRVIEGKSKLFDLKLKEVIKYRNLIVMLVKRDYATRYKQTFLGGLWLIITPITSTCINIILFSIIAGLSTDGIPRPMFYFLNNILWGFFSSCLISSANTFIGNAHLFGKIYFPRLVVPIASTITQFCDFIIKFALLVLVMLFYHFFTSYKLSINISILLLPVVFLQFSMIGIGLGIIISSLTVKYRDLQVLIGFGMQIWMYLTPVVYTISDIPEKWQSIYTKNPIYPGFIIFKHALFGVDHIPFGTWSISLTFAIAVFLIGILIFNHVERTFMDIV